MVRIGLVCLILGALSSCSTEDPWSDTCRLYDAYEESEGRAAGACDEVTAPEIVYEEMAGGLMGYYDGDNTIHVNDELRGDDKFATVIHEMVHYLDTMWLGLVVPGPAQEICISEDKAWFIEGVWWTMEGHPENARLDWWKSYPHCWPYFAPKTFQLTLQEWIIIMELGDELIDIIVE